MNLSDGKSAYANGSGGAWKTADVASDKFPAGLRVLVVDDDPTCLKILERMLLACFYKVTKCNRAEMALSFLRQEKNGFDVVLSDVHMPDMDGFKLLEHIGLEMDLPVIMMSADDGKDVVMKGVTHGACDYLIKPVRIEALKTIWQHVVRKKKNEWKESESVEDVEPRQQTKPSDDAENGSSGNEGSWRNSKKRKDEEEEMEDKDDSSTLKKPRVVWSVELHQQFVAAVHQLGIDKAVPKKILEMMNVPGLTRENVASHLQKYRLYLRRLSGVSPHQNGLNNSFMTTQDAAFGQLTSMNNGFDFQSLSSATGHFSVQNLSTLQAASLGRSSNKSGVSMPFAERNLFSFENPKLHQHQQQINHNNSKQVNLLHGIPTTMEAKQLPNFHLTPQSYARMNMQVNAHGNHNSPFSMLSSSLGHPKNGIVKNGRGTCFNTLSQSSSIVTLPMNRNEELQGYPPEISNLDSKGVFQIDIKSDVKRPPGFVPGYDIINQPQQRTQNWELQNVGLAFDASSSHHILPSVIVEQRDFSCSQNSGQNTMFLAGEVRGPHMNVQNIGQQLSPALVDDPLKFVKSEKPLDSNFGAMFFQEHFGQEDLMSALLKQQGGVGLAEPEFDFDGYSIDNIPV